MKRITAAVTAIIMVSIILAGCGTGSPLAMTPDPTTTAAPVTTTAATMPSTTTATETRSTTTAAPGTTTPAAATPSETPGPVETETPAVTATPAATAATAVFTASSPVSAFTAEDMALLGLDGLTGTPRQIADAIRRWQENDWTFVANTAGYEDVSDPIRWNYFLPGVFPSADIVRDQVRDGHVYGVCFSYAVAYASAAEYYGLEARIRHSVSRPSDSDPNMGPTTGMSPAEYERLDARLAALGLHYDYEAVRLVAEETPTHYWAEVRIDSAWIIEDATQQATGGDTLVTFVSAVDVEVYEWMTRDRSAELAGYQAQLDAGERLPESGGDATAVPVERAASIDEVMSGTALAPWFASAADAYAFVGATNVPAADIAYDQDLIDEYERRTGDRFYLVAALIAEDGPVSQFPARYQELSGLPLDVAVYLQLAGY